MTRTLDDSQRWLTEGTDRLLATVAALPDEGLDDATLLPGWDRLTLLAHVARNAGALRNLLSWARTGVEAPMYANAAERAAGIAELAAQPPAAVRAELIASADALERDLADLPADRWTQTVRTARGRPIPASEIPWMRVREVWVHLVDLDAGPTFTAVPDAVRVALLDDAAELMTAGSDAVSVRARDLGTGREWVFGPDSAAGTGPVAEHVVTADTVDLCAWVLGRPALLPPGTTWPALPPWL